MAYQGMPIGAVLASRGLGITLAESRAQLKAATKGLVRAKKISDADAEEKAAAAETAAFQGKLWSWLPWVAVGVAGLVAVVLVVKARKKRKKNPCHGRGGRRRNRRR